MSFYLVCGLKVFAYFFPKKVYLECRFPSGRQHNALHLVVLYVGLGYMKVNKFTFIRILLKISIINCLNNSSLWIVSDQIKTLKLPRLILFN